jgi:hypothetical protein
VTTATTERRHCTAKAKSTGVQCGNLPIKGTNVCRIHGGSIPAVRKAAARRLQKQQLHGDLGKLLEELEMDASEKHPVQALTDALARCSAMVAVLGALVGGLGVDSSKDGAQLVGKDHLGDMRENELVRLYGVWLDRSARTAKLALDAGVDERAIRIEEEKTEMLLSVFKQTFADPELGLTVAQRRIASLAAVRHLKALDPKALDPA